jgi:hypothetical protein
MDRDARQVDLVAVDRREGTCTRISPVTSSRLVTPTTRTASCCFFVRESPLYALPEIACQRSSAESANLRGTAWNPTEPGPSSATNT